MSRELWSWEKLGAVCRLLLGKDPACCLDHPLPTLKTALSFIWSFCNSSSPCRQPWTGWGESSLVLFQMSDWHRILMVSVGPHTNFTAGAPWGPLLEVKCMVIIGSESRNSAPGLTLALALLSPCFYPSSVKLFYLVFLFSFPWFWSKTFLLSLFCSL